MNKLILTDVDGVLLNWDEAFTKWMEAKGHVRPVGKKQHCYSLAKFWNVPEWVVTHLVEEFNQSSNTAFIKPFGEAGHYVKRLADKGFRFAACTSFGGNETSRALRRFNLRDVFGDVFREIEILPLGSDKRQWLKNFEGTECWWIEDHINNAKAGLELGLRPILVRHPYNEEYQDDDMLVAHNWREVYTIITGEKDYVD